MIDERGIMKYNAKMVEQANGAAQLLDSFLGGQYVMKEQARETIDFPAFRLTHEYGRKLDRRSLKTEWSD